MSHIRSDGSRVFRDRDDSTHFGPHMPIEITTSRRSCPAFVSRYSNTPRSDRTGVFSTIPAASRSFRRCDKSVGDIFGTPRRRSLKRVEPAIISRSRTIVQRVQSTSAAMARGQNCLYPTFDIVTLSKFEPRVATLRAKPSPETVSPDPVLGLERISGVLHTSDTRRITSTAP